MASLTLRQSKGSPLTFAEVDGNFTALNDDIALRAPLASPALTGTPTAPTAAAATNTTQIATTAFVKNQAYATLASPALTGSPTAPTPTAGDNDTSIATTAFVQSALIQSGPLAGFRNAIINGNFDIWQRGTSFTDDGYTADRWLFDEGTSATCTVTREAFALGQTDVPGEPTYYLRLDHTVASGSDGLTTIEQRIEGVRTLAGQEVTISFWGKCNVANPWNQGFRLLQNFGTGGSPSAQLTAFDAGTTGGGEPVFTTSWQKFTYTFTLPSISGKTLGTDGNDFLRLFFGLDRNQVFTLDIAQVQLEPGSVDTPFERRPIGVELALCERYYETSYPAGVAVGTYPTSGAGIIIVTAPSGTDCDNCQRFRTRKRATPTVVVYSPYTSTQNRVYRNDSGTDVEPLQFYTGDVGFGVGLTSVLSSDNYIEYLYTADAEL